jgi:uncharacterized protein GlcG (DUF336 family)
MSAYALDVIARLTARTTYAAQPMPLSLGQAQILITAAHDHARANGWKIAVAVVDEGGFLVSLARMEGAFPLSSQIAEAKAAGAALWHREGDRLADMHDAHKGFFDAVNGLVRLPLIPGPGSVLIEQDDRVRGAAGASGASGDDDRACVEAGLRAVFPSAAPA